MKIQAVHRRKKASAFVETRRKERAELEAAMANMTEEEKEALRMKKGSDREKLEAAARLDTLVDPAENPMDMDAGPPEKTPNQIKVFNILSSSAWMYATIFNTTYALFAQDITLWLLPKSADWTIAFLTLLVFLCFLFEWVGNMYSQRDYGAKQWPDSADMFFWLDCIGTFSLIPDFLIVFTGEELEVPDYVILARVARAARIGARLSRLTKLFRIAKDRHKEDPFAKLKEQEAAEKAEGAEAKPVDPDDPEADPEFQAAEQEMSSEIGDRVTEGISKRVIALVIILLVFVPIFTYQEPRGGIRKTKSDMLYMVHSMKRMDQDLEKSKASCEQTREADGTWSDWTCLCRDPTPPYDVAGTQDCVLATHYKESFERFLSYQEDNVIYFNWDREQLGKRPGGSNSYEIDDGLPDRGCADYTCEQEKRDGTAAHFFVHNSFIFEDLRLAEIRKYGDDDLDPFQEPIPDKYEFFQMEMWIDYRQKTQAEAFLNIVYMLVVCVIFAGASLVFMMDLNHLVIEPTENMSNAMRIVSSKLMDLGGKMDEDGEAAYVESSITKIVSLLKVSFGDAGTRIIANNMTAGADEIQPMIPGVKVSGVYGFCDIREFTATTEALRERICMFVNEFGNITHKQCRETGGAPNKNVGDAFLCCWIDEDDGIPKADDALLCYRRAIMGIRQSEFLRSLQGDRAIVERFPPLRQEFGLYYARMGVGLHYGDSIEGAIGTAKKIDASYLGSDVDLADVLEASTKIYKTPILMTESFFLCLSSEQQQTCRRVDKVSHGGGPEFWLYAANVHCDEVGNYFHPDVVDDVMPIEIDEYLAKRLQFGTVDGSEDPRENDERWRTLIDDWNTGFEEAVDMYVASDWNGAQAKLEECLADKPWDGPSKKLLQFMADNDVGDFKGYAEL